MHSQCPKCLKEFDTPGGLKKHMRRLGHLPTRAGAVSPAAQLQGTKEQNSALTADTCSDTGVFEIDDGVVSDQVIGKSRHSD